MLIPFRLLLYVDSFPKTEVYGGTIPQFFTQQNQSCTVEEGVLLSDSQSDGVYKQIQTYKTFKKNYQKELHFGPKDVSPQVCVDFFNQGLNLNASYWDPSSQRPQQTAVYESSPDFERNVESINFENQQKFEPDILSCSTAPTNSRLNTSAVEPRHMSAFPFLNEYSYHS